jgi:hypothetical protein
MLRSGVPKGNAAARSLSATTSPGVFATTHWSQLHLTEGAVKVAVHRLRQRFREVLRAQVAQTVARPEDIDEELRHLIGVLS